MSFHTENLVTWHNRLAHNNVNDVKKLPKYVTGMNISNEDFPICEQCETEKSKKFPVSKNVGD